MEKVLNLSKLNNISTILYILMLQSIAQTSENIICFLVRFTRSYQFSEFT